MPRRSLGHMSSQSEAISRAVLACFRESGFAGTSIGSIYAAAGLSVGAFYVHFASTQAALEPRDPRELASSLDFIVGLCGRPTHSID